MVNITFSVTNNLTIGIYLLSLLLIVEPLALQRLNRPKNRPMLICATSSVYFLHLGAVRKLTPEAFPSLPNFFSLHKSVPNI